MAGIRLLTEDNMRWIVGITLFIILIILCWLFIRGANMKRRNPEYGKQMDDEQEKILSGMEKRS